jgi:hypothetical protein
VFLGGDIVPPKFYILDVDCDCADIEHLKLAEFSAVHVDKVEIRRRKYTLSGLSSAIKSQLQSVGRATIPMESLLSAQSLKTGG